MEVWRRVVTTHLPMTHSYLPYGFGIRSDILLPELGGGEKEAHVDMAMRLRTGKTSALGNEDAGSPAQ